MNVMPIVVIAVLIILALLIPLFCIYFPQRKLEGVRYKKPKLLKKEKGVKFIAHRGLSGLYLENTLEAFEAAGKRNYYGIETDVHVTKDKKFIVAHDDDLKRIAGLDLIIEETDYETLRALRFKDPYGKGENEYRLPSLEEYVLVCKRYDKQAVLELKNKMEPQDVYAIAEAIGALGWLKRTTFISFSGENLIALRKKYPEADAQFLVEKGTNEEISFMIEHRLGGDLKWTAIKRKTVERLHKAGLKVNCWTVDGRVCAKVIMRRGVDQITSNIIE